MMRENRHLNVNENDSLKGTPRSLKDKGNANPDKILAGQFFAWVPL